MKTTAYLTWAVASISAIAFLIDGGKNWILFGVMAVGIITATILSSIIERRKRNESHKI